jgi:hypothetical protein
VSSSLAVARYLAVTSGRSALARALPLYLAIGIASVVLFAGNGLDARSVTAAVLESRGLRAALLGAWCLGVLPVARAWLCDRAALALRALPAPRAAVFGVLGAGCLAIQLPWAVLWLRGASPAAASWAVTVAVALLVTCVGGVRTAFDALGLGVALTSAWVGPDGV